MDATPSPSSERTVAPASGSPRGVSLRRLPAIVGTTAFRLSVVYLSAFIVFAFLLILFVGQRSTDILFDQARSTIAEEVSSLGRIYERGGVPLLFRQISRKARQPGANLFLIADREGSILAGNVRQIDPGVLGLDGWTQEPFHYRRYEGEGVEDRSYLATALVYPLPNGMRLLVGRDVEEARRLSRVLDQALQIALALMVVGALLAWLLVGRQALRRIDELSVSSDRILAGDRDARLPVGRSGDEFDRLSERINTMLERINRMNAGLKQVADSIAHDLKTPLTRLRNRAEAALAGARDDDHLRAIIEEADQLIATFNALLTISRAEAGARTAEFLPLRVDEIVADLHDLYEPVAEEQGARLILGSLAPAPVHGSRELLAQAVTNLIENAVKYARREDDDGRGSPGTRAEGDGPAITLSVERAGGRVVIVVSDDGPGIPAAERERVTQRFVRLDESRNAPGSGLGLSLVKAVVEMHGGTLGFHDAAPGLRAEIGLPAMRTITEGSRLPAIGRAAPTQAPPTQAPPAQAPTTQAPFTDAPPTDTAVASGRA